MSGTRDGVPAVQQFAQRVEPTTPSRVRLPSVVSTAAAAAAAAATAHQCIVV